MKTKISHLGRSTVSVILAVMMLLSTMLIGTVSTVNAVQLTKGTELYLIGEMNDWKTLDDWKLTQKSNDSNYYSGKFIVDGSNGDISFKLLDKTNNKYYSKNNTSFSSNDTVCSGLSDDTSLSNMTIKPITSGKITIDVTVYCEYSGDSRLEIKQTVSVLPKVADSVTLTASPETVTSGGSTTLTATLKNKAEGVGNVTYTFTDANNNNVGTKTTSDSTATIDVTPSATTTYTVSVSADNYTSVTNTVKVTATSDSSDKYAIHVRLADNLDSYTLWLWAWEDGGSNAYGDVSWKSDDVKVSLNDHEWHDYPFKNSVKNWKLIIAYGKGETKFDGPYNSDLWVTVKGDNDYDVSPTAPTKYTVTYGVDGGNGTLTADGVTSGSTVNSGTKVTFTATPSEGYAVEGWYSDAECANKIETAGTNKTYTEKVNADTNVYVKFREAKPYTVEFSSSNDSFGTVSAMNGTTSLASGATVTEGDEVTFTAKPKEGYALSGWTVNGAPASSTTNPYKITVNSNTTVVANFKEATESGYYLLCGTDATFQTGKYTPVPLYKKEEGVYYADFDVAQNSIPKYTDYFIIFSKTKDTSGIINAKDDVTVNTVDQNGFSLNNYYGNIDVGGSGNKLDVKFAKVRISKDEVTGFTIKINNLDLNSNKITYSAEPKFKEAPKNAVNIIAKNGTQTAKFQNMGTTVITKVDDVVFDIGKYNDNAYTQKATAIKGNKVTVTTTVDEKYKDTYYVKGFVVNGESYGIQSGPNDDGVYTLEYQIPDDVADGTNFEITPVYFLKDSSNCVTFYVEGFDGAVQDSWGNTIACYPYYEGVDKNSTNNNAFGAYPGQPLLYEGGKYYTQIPKSITLDGAKKKIVGMTLNNFALESVHGAISTIKENKQSYDYDDFVRIANNNYGNNIIYTFKYSTAKDNFGEKTVSPTTITKDEFNSSNGNGWEDLTDYNHRKVDLFGNVLTGADSEKEPLLVVSNGYFENYQGFYATEWTVYELKNGAYSKITQIPSSALLLKSKDDLTNSTSDEKYKNSLASYADAYGKLEAYKNTPALITFESSIKRGYSLQGGTNGGEGGESADRVDGRWYYSMIGEEITAKIAVEYGDTATSSFTNDPFDGDTNKTTTIGAQAYFTNDAAFGKTTYKSNIDSSKYFTFTADTIATDKDGQNYVFLGWYLLSDNKYTKLTDAKAPMTGSDTFVARYVKAPAGTVTIDHRLFSAASNPTPTQNVGTGSGKCYVTVRVLDEAGNEIKKFAETENSVTLDKTYIDSSKNYKLEITLKTVTSGKDKFDKFYYLAQDKQTYDVIDPSTTTTEDNVTTVTREVDIRKNFFKLNDDGTTYSFKNETGSDSIHYYSDITETKIPYKITFNYEPRLKSDAKQYVVTGEFTSEYILNHKAELTNDFVMSVAPYEDNFFNTIKWDDANIKINNDGETKTAVIESTTSLRTVTVKAFDAEDKPIEAYKLNGVPEFTSTVVYGKLLTYKNLRELTDDQRTEIPDGKEYIYVADSEYNGKKFSYWQISTSLNKDDTSAYVTKCFSREFNYIAYNNYYIWPVYGESQSITGASTTLNFLDYSRNQSTDENGDHKTDRVFADFALAFDSNGIQLQTYKGDNIKVGMFLEVCGDLKSDSTGNVITNIDQYKNMPEYSTSEKDLESIKNAILEGSDTKSLTYTTEAGITRKLLNKPIDINSLDNKNRIEYYVGYNNNPNNQKKLMRAYSYVIVDGKITLCSTPYSFVNYYNVGNKTYTVS